MKLAIMQPYLFPYMGYFQLIKSVDAFVVYDDVNYRTGGWINRNFILSQGTKQLITLPLSGASQNKLISQISVGDKRQKILKSIRQTYSKAPYFSAVFPIVEDIFAQTEKNLARFLDYQLRRICDYLCLYRNWYISSEIYKPTELRGQNKILAICNALAATQYINLPGGRMLYEREVFAAHGIQLSFLSPGKVCYRQFGREMVSGLSILDVMMFNDADQCAQLLEEYQID